MEADKNELGPTSPQLPDYPAPAESEITTGFRNRWRQLWNRKLQEMPVADAELKRRMGHHFITPADIQATTGYRLTKDIDLVVPLRTVDAALKNMPWICDGKMPYLMPYADFLGWGVREEATTDADALPEPTPADGDLTFHNPNPLGPTAPSSSPLRRIEICPPAESGLPAFYIRFKGDHENILGSVKDEIIRSLYDNLQPPKWFFLGGQVETHSFGEDFKTQKRHLKRVHPKLRPATLPELIYGVMMHTFVIPKMTGQQQFMSDDMPRWWVRCSVPGTDQTVTVLIDKSSFDWTGDRPPEQTIEVWEDFNDPRITVGVFPVMDAE